MTDPDHVRMPSITEYWKPLAEDVSILAFLHLVFNRKLHGTDLGGYFCTLTIHPCAVNEVLNSLVITVVPILTCRWIHLLELKRSTTTKVIG